MRTILKGLLLVLVGFLAVLVPIAPAVAAGKHNEMELRFLVGTGQICSLAPDACPDVSKAANGDTISLAGQGTISTGDDEGGAGDATGHGTFIHMKADGSVLAQGTWKATRLLSFTPYGSGSVQGLPANFQGGLAKIGITLRANLGDRTTVLHGILAVDCVLGHPPSTDKEGVTLTVPNLITFDTKVSGFTLFIADNND
ncbi:MAG TPA: hypothetical protein VGS11_01005 [Candidatus Bathyarchaeia archaeon]|nr:hypothetical protein [Candidatus Bathyarchaeia archaeon]